MRGATTSALATRVAVRYSRFMNRIVISALVTLLLSACSHERRATSGIEFVILVPDSRSDVVHRIGMDGRYEGDFLDPARFESPSIHPSVWRSPRGLIQLEGSDGRIWMVSARALSEWSRDGAYVRTLFSDTALLEDPVAIGRVGDEVLVLSEDKTALLVFDVHGNLVRKTRDARLRRAKDFVLGANGRLYVGARRFTVDTPGLVTVWDPAYDSAEPQAVDFYVAPETDEDGTFWVHSLAFDDVGKLLIIDFAGARLERWDLARNAKVAVLLDGDMPGQYAEIARGPDGLAYLAGSDGIYRFDSRASAEDLKSLKPFFDARSIADRYEGGFSPAWLAFVARSEVGEPRTQGR